MTQCLNSTTGKTFIKKPKYKKLFEIFSPLKPIFTPNYDEVMILLNDNNKNESIEKTLKNLYLKYKTPFIITGIKKNKRNL